MRTALILVALLGACTRPEPAPAPEPGEKRTPASAAPEGGRKTPGKTAAPAPPPLPEGFAVRGTPRVEEPFLTPAETWRFIVSRLATLQADAQVRGEALLVTLEAAAVHVTDRAGNRRTWLLPEGLRLEGGPVHVVLKPDLFLVPYGADGVQVPAREEVALVTAHAAGPGDSVEVFRLVVKGGRAFRSISTPG